MEDKDKSNSYVYTMPCKPSSVFVNFGKDCLNDCKFCVKRFGNFFGYFLNVEYTPETLGNIEKGLERIAGLYKNPKEIVICGTGEPFLYYEEVIEVSKIVRKLFEKGVPIRADTTGLWWQGRGDLSFLEHINSLSVSLNAECENKYNEMCQPKIPNAYGTLMDFLKTLSEEKKKRREFPDIRLTIVDTSFQEYMPPKKETDSIGECPSPDIAKCQDIADSFGFPLVVKHLFRDVNELCWNIDEIEAITLRGISLERCIDCKYRHI